MENQNSLSAYLISDKTPIFLENTLLGLQGFQSVATEQELTQTASVVSHDYILGPLKQCDADAAQPKILG
jgi:hypothetical protein